MYGTHYQALLDGLEGSNTTLLLRNRKFSQLLTSSSSSVWVRGTKGREREGVHACSNGFPNTDQVDNTFLCVPSVVQAPRNLIFFFELYAC